MNANNDNLSTTDGSNTLVGDVLVQNMDSFATGGCATADGGAAYGGNGGQGGQGGVAGSAGVSGSGSLIIPAAALYNNGADGVGGAGYGGGAYAHGGNAYATNSVSLSAGNFAHAFNGSPASADNNHINAFNDIISATGSDNLMVGDVAVIGEMQAIGQGGNAVTYGGAAYGGDPLNIYGAAYGGFASAHGGGVHNLNSISLFAGNGARFDGGPASVYGGFAHADLNVINVGNDLLAAGAGFNAMAGDVPE